MTQQVRPIPEGFHTITPHLVCSGAADALTFYTQAFGAIEMNRMPGPGGKINTVPALATFSIDRRVLAIENHAAAERELRVVLAATARQIPDCRITVAKTSENFACFTPPKHPFFAAAADSVTRVRRKPTTFNVSTGFNDMHFFSHHLGIPTLGYGPGGEDYHAVDERARVRDLVDAAKIYADLLTTFAG